MVTLSIRAVSPMERVAAIRFDPGEFARVSAGNRARFERPNRGRSHQPSPTQNHYLPNRTRTPIRRRQLVERDRMKKEMLINVLQPEECRIAIIEDGVLEELYVERTSHESYTGNIYKGRIVNLEPAIQAAFVDFSVGRNGFLHVSDVEPQYFDRLEGPHDELDAGTRDRDRERKRDPRRGRGRDDRRGACSTPGAARPSAGRNAASPAPAGGTAARAGTGTRSRQGPGP